MQPKCYTVGFLALMLAATQARGDLVEIGPFTGALTESWESFPTSEPEGDQIDDPSTILAGGATISNPFMEIYEPGVNDNSLGSSGIASVADGNRAMQAAAINQTVILTFSTPVTEFGAYWGAYTSPTFGDPALIEFNFFDEFNNPLGTETIDYSRSGVGDGLLEWHGWSSSIPIRWLSYTEDAVAVDSLQANPIPEPSSLFLAVSIVLLCSRRLGRRFREI